MTGLTKMEQLLAFCDWERAHNPHPDGAPHIAEWAAKEIERFSEALAASRAENARLRRRRNEIDDEAEEYAEQVERLHAKLQRLQSTNRHIANMLSNAERAGGETDQPEGTRYITLSDTLARQIVKELTAEDEEE